MRRHAQPLWSGLHYRKDEGRACTADLISRDRLRFLTVCCVCFPLFAIAVSSRSGFEQTLGCTAKLRGISRLALASLMPASWNQIDGWLRQIDALRQVA